ncbi:MAG: hypothetical protein M1617_08580 [Actinobacteria bacterium]|nr:hypothetical protein [Actinomycetota bacterium]
MEKGETRMVMGAELLQGVSERVLLRFLRATGHGDARTVSRDRGIVTGSGIDLAYSAGGRVVTVKVKPDPYFGTNPMKIQERALAFYRPDAGHYAFEAISNSLTREPGWMFSSSADQLFYYFIALDQTEHEVAALYAESDEIFFSELRVERDELRILPMDKLRSWFEANFDAFTPRPVALGDHSAWFRLIPRADIESAIDQVKTVTPVFAR